MITFILWCIVFVLCWPLALLALALYPVVWLVLLRSRSNTGPTMCEGPPQGFWQADFSGGTCWRR
jgi:hypothetical protein